MKKNNRNRFWLWLLPLSIILALVFNFNIHYPIWMDEYVFYRLSGELPFSYATTSDWLIKDRPTTLNPSKDIQEGFDYMGAIHLTYDNPIYTHTPLMPLLVSPLVHSLNWLADKEVIPHIEEQAGSVPVNENTTPADLLGQRVEVITFILRLIPIALFVLSMYLIFKILERKVGQNSLFYVLPVAVSIIPIMGVFLFYWDVFMAFFCILTLYLMETRPNSKWQYVTACCMINTKMFVPFLFLMPLVVFAFTQGGWRKALYMALTSLSLIPFLTGQWIVSGDPFYSFTHYISGLWITKFVYTLVQPSAILNYEMVSYFIMTLPLFIWFKKYPVYATFLLATLIYSFGTGLGITHLSNLVYAGALSFPLIAHELRLAERIGRWLGIKQEGEAVESQEELSG